MPAVVQAQGFQLNEIGSCALARGQAVTAAPCNDPSAIYWNPAATTSLSGWSAYFGAAWINVQGSYTSDTTGTSTPGAVPPAFPPNIFVNYTAPSHKWAAGLGVYAPYGLTSAWPNGFQGNFIGQKAALATIYVQPNFAYEINQDWSVGAGFVFGYSTVQLKEALDLSTQFAAPGLTFGMLGIPTFTQFGLATINGSATQYGFSLGVHGKIGSDWQVGARYLSQMNFQYKNGQAKFTQVSTGLAVPASGIFPGVPAGTPIDALLTPEFLVGGPLVSQGATTQLNHPWQGELGLAYTGFTNWTLEMDYQVTGFSSFKNIDLQFTGPAVADSQNLIQDYTNSWSIRAGAEHAFASGIKGRIGASYVSSPVPDVTVTPLLPDQNRENIMLGAGFPLGATWSLDAAYEFVNTQGRRGRVVDRTNETQTAADLNTGWYQLHANILSVSLKANF
jgi:long-chain fatty acid transport protein